MKFWTSVWRWVDHNRWTVAVGCQPQVESPLTPGKIVDDRGLQLEFKTWQHQTELMAVRFESAGEELTEEKERLSAVKNIVLNLATGSVNDLPTLLKLLLEGGAIGLLVDAVRKGGVIAGLKRNKS